VHDELLLLIISWVVIRFYNFIVALPLLAQAPGDWPMYSHDLAATRYSPLEQITASNASRLVPAWTFRLNARAMEVTPLVVSGVMYLSAGKRVVALEADTGKEIWSYEVQAGNPSTRGVAYWPGDRENPARIIFTSGHLMFGLNASTGKVDPGFGKEGQVDLVVGYNAPPTVFRNLLFVGANAPEQPAVGPSGDTRAYDARTGAKLWEFHSVPRAGETGNATWEADAWKDRTGVNNWGFFMTVDAARGILYTVFGSPASDYYGADRNGNNLFGNSVVALEATTGKLLWYFQAVHHDIWDFDLPPAPVLADVRINGRTVPILAQTGKVGYMYILNRVTGKPVFGMDEKAVPQSTVPGEHTSATQPIPVKPAELARHGFALADLVTAEDTTPEHAKACREMVEKSGTVYNEGPFTPWVFRGPAEPQRFSVIFPGAIGGTDWGGMSVDPRLGYAFVNTSDFGSMGWIEKMPEGSRVPYDQRSVYGNPVASKFWARAPAASGGLLGEEGWPCQKPPWGRLSAVNLKTGEIAWQVRLGITDELPDGKQNTGRINLGGSIATAGGVVFIGASNDKRFRAFDSRTGKELWAAKLDYSAIAVPVTYLGRNGKQYVAISASGHSPITTPNPANTESLHVFALP
jgi:glucose dehydrogenase